MIRILSILFMLTGIACNFAIEGSIPKVGNVIHDASMGGTTTPHDTMASADTSQEDSSNTASDSSETNTYNDSHTPPNDTVILGPPPAGLRSCSKDWECQNGTEEGTYHCSDGICTAPSLPCTTAEVCADTGICNGVEVCYQGHCALGTRWECDDGNSWTGEDCNPSSGCIYWDIYECTQDEDCHGTDVRCDTDTLHGKCVEIPPCVEDSECDDGNACTADRCLHNTCDNSTISCFDFDPDTLNICDINVGCLFPEACTKNSDCDDWDLAVKDTCVDGQCVHTLEYIFLSILSANHQGDHVDLYFGTNIAWSGAIPYQMYVPFQGVCINGILIDVYDPDYECISSFDGIDVWMENTKLDYILVPDECGAQIFVPPDQFGCDE